MTCAMGKQKISSAQSLAASHHPRTAKAMFSLRAVEVCLMIVSKLEWDIMNDSRFKLRSMILHETVNKMRANAPQPHC
jgi:hypothetical protein